MITWVLIDAPNRPPGGGRRMFVSRALPDATGVGYALCTIPVAASAGFAAGLRPGSGRDRLITSVAIALDSIPDFVLAVVLVTVVSLRFDLLPATFLGTDLHTLLDRPEYLALPLIVTVARVAAPLVRLVRAGVIDTADRPYIAAARRLGVPRWSLLIRHRGAVGHSRRGAVGRRRLSAAVRRERITQALSAAAFDIADRDLGPLLRKYPFEFSGGERTRLALAQVLVGGPEVLVVDEPTVGLDSVARDALLTGLAGLRSRGRAVLLVTHDGFAVDQISDHTLFVRDGRLAGHHAPGTLRVRPRPERPDHAPVLRVRDLAVGPRADPVLHDIDLDLYPGEMLGLIGVSGAGKSTLARCLAGLARPAAGRITTEGEALPVLRRRTRRRIAEIQYVWQESAATFDARRPVLDQVAATGIRLRGMAAAPTRAAAVTLLADLGIDSGQAARRPVGRAVAARRPGPRTAGPAAGPAVR